MGIITKKTMREISSRATSAPRPVQRKALLPSYESTVQKIGEVVGRAGKRVFDTPKNLAKGFVRGANEKSKY